LRDAEDGHDALKAGGVDRGAYVDGCCEEADQGGDEAFLAEGPVLGVFGVVVAVPGHEVDIFAVLGVDFDTGSIVDGFIAVAVVGWDLSAIGFVGVFFLLIVGLLVQVAGHALGGALTFFGGFVGAVMCEVGATFDVDVAFPDGGISLFGIAKDFFPRDDAQDATKGRVTEEYGHDCLSRQSTCGR
jgi:hypothetical protein